MHLRILVILAPLALGSSGCGGDADAAVVGAAIDPLRVVLAPQQGNGPLDRRIAAVQQRIATNPQPVPLLEQLGNLFVVKARTDSDPGCFELARQCALAIEARTPGDPTALLLRGHVLHQEHRFAEAEAVARQLVAARGDFLDQGLLGDVLFDEGRTPEARACYQQMLDLKPCLQSYARAAQLRWRTGDLDAARELLDLAMHSGSSRDPEAMAWVHADRARLELAAGAVDASMVAASAALDVCADYPPALLAMARARLARGEAAAAIELLERARKARPEPEYLWALREACEQAGRVDEAASIDTELRRRGAVDDPRTLALYLATRGADGEPGDAELALQLARRELAARQDPRTHDALAWALHRCGHDLQAADAARQALADGEADPRILLHAGSIAQAIGNTADATRWLQAAAAGRAALLPSETRTLDTLLRTL